MKKLFSILTTVGVSFTTTVSTVACNHTKSGNKEKGEYEKDQELEEKQRNLIISGINELLSDLKYEIKDGSTHYKSEKAGLDITIGEKDKRPDDHDKKYISISDLTKTLRDDKKYIASWDTVEIITIFATNKADLSDNEAAIKRNIEPKEPKWGYWDIKYVEGVVSAEEVNRNGPPNKLLWKMGYLNKESYYVSLVDMAINAYFGGDTSSHEHYPRNAFTVKTGTEFNKDWIEQNVSKFITKDDENFKNELMNRFKEVKIQAYLPETKNKPAEPIEGVSWNPTDPTEQYLYFNVKFTSRYDIWFYIYLKPE